MEDISASCVSLNIVGSSEEKTEKGTRQTLYRQLIATILAASFNIVFGISLAYSAILNPELAKNTSDIPTSETQRAWAASALTLAMPVGAPVSGILMDTVGRLNTVKIACVPAVIGWALIAISSDFYTLIAGRVFTGIASESLQDEIALLENIQTIQDEFKVVEHEIESIKIEASLLEDCLCNCKTEPTVTVFGTAPAIVYITEIARSDLRGSLISFGPAISSVGMVMAYIEGWFLSWRLTAWLCVIYSAISFILLMLIPESPMWLIAKEKNTRALKSLQWFTKSKPYSNMEGRKTPAEIEFENLREINEQKIASGQNRGGISDVLQGFLKPTGYKPFLILFGLFIFQQFSGVYITLFYSIQFFEEMGTNINPYLCSIFIGLVRAGMSGVNTYMLKTFRRRPLLIWSSLGMAITMLISGLFTVWIKDGTTTLKWVPVLATLLYVVSSMIGLLTIPWTMTAELFPIEIRAIAHSCLYSAAYLIMFFSIQNYNGLKRLCGGIAGVQWFFAAVSLAGLVYTGLFLPETYKCELSEIEDYFKYNTLYLWRKKGRAEPRRGSRYSYRKPPSDIVKKIVLDTVSENSNEQNKNLLTVN